MVSGKIIVKKGLSRFLSSCRLFASFERFRLRDKAFVLMYHRVLGSEDCNGSFLQPGMYVKAASFEKQIAFLKKRFRVVSIEELIGKIREGDVFGGHCAITFDDGWRDNYTNAFPILKKYQVYATIFLATSFIGTDRLFWPDELAHSLDGEFWMGGEGTAPPCVERFRRKIEKYRLESRETLLDRAIEILKQDPPIYRERILAFCRKTRRAAHKLPRQMMTWEEAQKMVSSGLVSFGAHTVEHQMLDQLPVAEARREIIQSREDIYCRLGVDATIFAYPNGNYNETVKQILRDSGFAGAVTTRKGFLTHGTQPLEIPRIGIHEDISNTVPMFQGRILLENF